MFNQSIPNWINWIGLIVTVLGLPLTCIGLYITYRQSFQAKTLAKLASEKSEEALGIVRSRTRLSTLSSALSQTETVISIMDSGHVQASRAYFNSFRKEVQLAMAMHPDSKNIDRQVKVSIIIKKLEATAVLIDSKKDSSDEIKRGVNNNIRIIRNFLFSEYTAAETSEVRR